MEANPGRGQPPARPICWMLNSTNLRQISHLLYFWPVDIDFTDSCSLSFSFVSRYFITPIKCSNHPESCWLISYYNSNLYSEFFFGVFCFEERTICRANESKTNVELSLISKRSKLRNFVGDTVHWFLWQSICTIRPNLVSTVSRDLAFMQPQVWQMWCIKVHIHDEWVFIVIVCRSCERRKMNIQYIYLSI